MFKIWFHGTTHFLVWLLAVCVLYALNMAIYDMGSRDTKLFPENVPPVVSSESSKTPKRGVKLVIIFIEGLDVGNFIGNILKSRVLSRAVAIDGTWSIMRGELPLPGSIGFEPFFTGNPEGFGPSVLANFDSVMFAGKSHLARGFKLPTNFSGTFQVLETEEEDTGHSYGGVDLAALTPVMCSARRETLWKSKQSKEVLIVHLTALGLANSLEGRMSVKANSVLEATFQHLDSLINTLETTSPAMLTYFVSSVGIQVPLVAWGPGIDRAQSSDKQVFEYSAYQIPTAPRDLNVLSVASLLSCLLGVSPPSNSMGTLPDQFLKMDHPDISACHVNVAREVKDLYFKQANEIINGGLMKIASIPTDLMTLEDVAATFKRMERMHNSADYTAVGTLSRSLVKQCLVGITHYRNVRARFLSHLIFILLLGCIWCGIILLAPALSSNSRNRAQSRRDGFKVGCVRIHPTVDFIFTAVLSLSITVMAVDNFPRRYLFYVSVVIVPWWVALRNIRNLTNLLRGARGSSDNFGQRLTDVMYVVLSLIAGVVIAHGGSMIQVFLLSMVFLCLLTLATPSDAKVTLWMFTTLPVVFVLSHSFNDNWYDKVYLIGAFLWLAVPWVVALIKRARLSDYPLLVVNTVVILITTSQCCTGLSCHGSWLTILAIPMLGSQDLLMRFIQTFMSLGASFLLISSGGEPLALMVFVLHTTMWMLAESHPNYKDFTRQPVIYSGTDVEKKFDSADLRMNYFYNMYCLLAILVAHSIGYSDECTVFTRSTSVIGRFLRCEMKMAVPILCVSTLYAHMTIKNGANRYYSFLISFIYFTYSIFLSFWRVYRFSWEGPLPTSHQLGRIHTPISVWCSQLFCSLISDGFLWPSLLSKNSPSRVQ